MSWDIFKNTMKSYMDNPNGVKSKEEFAKKFTQAYNNSMLTGTVFTKGFGGAPLPIQKGNVQLMETMMILACANAFTKSDPGKHSWLTDIGKAVIGYWTGATLMQVPPMIPAIGSFQNIALNSGIVSNPGTWPPTPPEQPSSTTDIFIDLFISYAKIHLTTIQFSCITTSLYPGFPLVPPSPGFINLIGYQVQ